LDLELGGDAHAADEGHISCHIICHMEMWSKHVMELISLRGDRNNTSPYPI
jgi:hypothetical protein